MLSILSATMQGHSGGWNGSNERKLGRDKIKDSAKVYTRLSYANVNALH